MWWPGIDQSIEHFVSHSTACTIADNDKHALTKPPIKPVPFTAKQWSMLCIDILGEMNGVPSVTAFMSNLVARWGIPDGIISDNGIKLVSMDFDQFCAQLGIKHCKTALYHPQAKGAVERFNRDLEEGIRALKAEGRAFADSLRSIISNYR